MISDASTGQTIGIIGGGHLGRALALAFIGRGFPPGKILISHGENPETAQEIRQAGLEHSLAPNDTIGREATIVFITVRPQSFMPLQGLPFRKTSLIVSCMAGIPSELLRGVLGVPAIRIMPSGPETLLQCNGIVGMYPDDGLVRKLLSSLGQEVFIMHDDDEMNIFTAGVCLPSVIIAARMKGQDTDKEIEPVIFEYPIVARIYDWAKKAVPQPLSPEGQDEYIRRMSTKGGITEIIVTRIRTGATLLEAFHAGIDRSRAISEESRHAFG